MTSILIAGLTPISFYTAAGTAPNAEKTPAIAMAHIGRDEGNTVSAALRSVTVYRSGAELVHQATVSLRQGNNEVVIEDISNKIDLASVQVSSPGNVTIMSVAFSTEFLKPVVQSPLVVKLTDSVEGLVKEQARIDMLIQTDNDLLGVLSANKTITGTTTSLSAAELARMIDYYKAKSTELRADLLGLEEKKLRVELAISKLSNQIGEEEKKNGKTSGRLLLQLLSPSAGNFDLTISYLTPSAYWNPSYDLKVTSPHDPLKLLYKAKLVQTTGLDWKKVKLSLSTASPDRHGDAPLLKAWFLRFVDPFALLDKDMLSNTLTGALKGRVAGLQSTASLNEVVVVGYGTAKREVSDSEAIPAPAPLFFVNGKAVTEEQFKSIDKRAIKSINVLKDAAATSIYGSRAASGVTVVTLKEELGDYVSVQDNQTDVVFDIDLPYDVPTNGKEQGVVLKGYDLQCRYDYYCVPVLDKDVYMMGQLPDWEKLNLLPGEANIIMEGTYTGQSPIDPNSTLDTLSLTLGKDRRVVVKREKVVDYSAVKFMGSNKKQTFTYEITVKNNKKDSINLLLKDQYPIPSTKDIEVELLESSDAAANNETGVLTWHVPLRAGETRKFRISYSVKYPKDKTLNIK